MKSIVSTLIISCLLVLTQYLPSQACSYSSYSPDEYFMFRLPGEKSIEKNAQNCLLWAKQVNGYYSNIEDTHEVVYNYEIDQIKHIKQLINNTDWYNDSLIENDFVYDIVSSKDIEAIDFLLLAKQCSLVRSEMNNPWHYHYPDSPEMQQLNKIINQCLNYKEDRFRERYALQAVRALFSTEQYDRCINYWDSISPLMEKSVLYDMTEEYIAGICFRRGEIERAKQIYARLGALESLINCYKGTITVDEITLLHQYNPDSPNLKKFLSKKCRHYEWVKYCYFLDNDSIELKSFNTITYNIAKANKAKDLDMWYYVTAFTSYLLGNEKEAQQLIHKAESVRGSEDMKEIIKVFRIYIDSKIDPINSSYEKRLLTNLRWLDKKVSAEISQITFDNNWDLDGFIWKQIHNYSQNYWNDMMKRIILGASVPRYIKQGNLKRAMQLSNMASNRCYQILNETINPIRQSTIYFNDIDYKNAFFELIDSLPTEEVAKYVHEIQSPCDELDRFTMVRSYIDKDYLNDIIGTKYLREMNYDKASYYLSLISPNFQYRLNTHKHDYMRYNPFEFPREANKMNKQNIIDYKYKFATKMNNLEKEIENTVDTNRRGLLLLEYSRGMEASFNRCWALTSYRKNDDLYDERNDVKLIRERAKILEKEGFALITDPEIKAYMLWQYYNNSIVRKKYPKTQTARLIRIHCDRRSDYTGTYNP